MKMEQTECTRTSGYKFQTPEITQKKKRIQFLYCTVTIENAARHVVTSNIRKWPHRETFSTSSSCCMNLWIKRTGVQKILNVLLLQRFSLINFMRRAICILFIWRNVQKERILNFFFIFGTQVNIRYGNVCTSFHLSLHSCVIYLFWTHSSISWWCRMHAFSLACNSQFATVWTCSSSCPCRGVVCCCLISNMAAFSLSNWVQAIEINTITRGG